MSLAPRWRSSENFYGLAIKEFANGPGDWGSIPGRVVPKSQKMVFDAVMLNNRHYKVWIKGKVKPSKEKSITLSYFLV